MRLSGRRRQQYAFERGKRYQLYGRSSEVKEVRNFNGEEFVIGSHFIEGMFQEPGKSEFGDQLLARWEELEQEYNCKFVTKTAPADTWMTEVMTNIAAGEKYADLIETNLWWFSDIVRADYLEDLEQVNDLHFDDDIWYPTLSKAAEYKGKTYGVNWLTWYNKLPFTSFYVVYFNKRLIADANQPDPYELFEKGEWTWENFRNIAKATDNDKDDIDGIVAFGPLPGD